MKKTTRTFLVLVSIVGISLYALTYSFAQKQNYSYGIMMQTKCVSGVCTTVRKYMSPTDISITNQKMAIKMQEIRDRIRSKFAF